MLPVALTCPLWWVARWATRVLTSLAVVAALALGAGQSPVSAAAPEAPAAAHSAFTTASFAPSGRSASAAGAEHATAESPTAQWSADPRAVPSGGLGILAAPTDVTPPRDAGSDPLPRTDGASRAPRAPPGR